MEQALYRKYRPTTFADTVGQEHVTKTLQQAIKTGRISHAYLFTGPRGVGKTSVARILAHEANQLPYKGESIHLDIIEIDAASNRRIDEIRDLRERVRIAPVSAKYKVYIIDEVHMLTREAFNALLKTLEEPPAHCLFILATTEAHKLPETIISRTQRFEFKPVGTTQSANHLGKIAKSEHIDISPGALKLLAEFGEGSFRDSIGYLDQLSSRDKKISEDDVRKILGLPSRQIVLALLEALRRANIKAVAQLLQDTKEQGISAPELADALSKELRQLLIGGEGGALESQLLKLLIEVKTSARPYDYLEVILLEAAIEFRDYSDNPPKTKVLKGRGITTPALKKAVEPTTKNVAKPADNKIVPKAEPSSRNFSLDMWDNVVERAKSQAASIYTALRLAQPALEDGILVLAFQFPLHKKKLDQAKNKGLVSGLIEEVSGDKIHIECIVDKSLAGAAGDTDETTKTAEPVNPLHSITNIFGTAEMLES